TPWQRAGFCCVGAPQRRLAQAQHPAQPPRGANGQVSNRPLQKKARNLPACRNDRRPAGPIPAELRSETETRVGRPRSRRSVGQRRSLYRREVTMMTTTVRDVRVGLRMLRRNPAFAILAVACLTLGIGANAAVFS